MAQETHYHCSWYKLFTHDGRRNLTQFCGDDDAKERNVTREIAFEYLSDYINESIIKNSIVELLGMLKEKYLLFIQENHPHNYNPNYKTNKLKDKILKCFQ